MYMIICIYIYGSPPSKIHLYSRSRSYKTLQNPREYNTLLKSHCQAAAKNINRYSFGWLLQGCNNNRYSFGVVLQGCSNWWVVRCCWWRWWCWCCCGCCCSYSKCAGGRPVGVGEEAEEEDKEQEEEVTPCRCLTFGLEVNLEIALEPVLLWPASFPYDTNCYETCAVVVFSFR